MLPRRVADLVHEPVHSGSLDEATAVGEALGDSRLLVRVGLWLDERGQVRRARHRASTCASLIAYAEAACELAEAGVPPTLLGAERILAAVSGAHPLHRDRAELVAMAVARAVESRRRSPEVSP